jgi:hypothetical protein
MAMQEAVQQVVGTLELQDGVREPFLSNQRVEDHEQGRPQPRAIQTSAQNEDSVACELSD